VYVPYLNPDIYPMKLASKILALAAAAAGLASAASAAIETYAIDPVHSSVASRSATF